MDRTATAPVSLSVTVRATTQRAFEVFTDSIGDWWPVSTHSIEGEQVTSARMECREGGRIFEFHHDGTELNWGTILVWEPPHRLVFSWNPSRETRPETEVEVNFVALSENETRVDLEHRNWERLGDEGPELRKSYAEGWAPVLDRFVEVATS